MNNIQQAIEKLKAVLCDPEGTVVIAGSDGDSAVVQEALAELESEITALHKCKCGGKSHFFGGQRNSGMTRGVKCYQCSHSVIFPEMATLAKATESWNAIALLEAVPSDHQPVESPLIADAKNQIGAYANIHPDERQFMTFGFLLKCLWRLHGARETMGYQCAEIMAGLLDSAPKRESSLQPLKDHLLGMLEYGKGAGALSFPMAYELHQKTLEAVATLVRIENYVATQIEGQS